MIDKITDFLAEPLPRKILFFDNLLTPSLIRTAYWLGLLAVVWLGLGHMFSNGFFGLFEGLVQIAFGVIVLRVAAELVMLFFKMHDNLKIIAENTQAKQPLSDTAAAVPAVKRKKASKKAGKKASKKVTKASPKSSE